MKEKPNWKKGDIVCLICSPHFRGPSEYIFIAEHDPRWDKCREKWFYGWRDAYEVRLADSEDIDFAIQNKIKDRDLVQARIDELKLIRVKMEQDALHETTTSEGVVQQCIVRTMN